MTSIQTMFPEPFVGFRNTDHNYLSDLTELSRRYPVQLLPLDHWQSVVTANLLYAGSALLTRVPLVRHLLNTHTGQTARRMVPLTGRYLRRQKPDLLFTNGYVPLVKADVPMLLEADFFDYRDLSGNSPGLYVAKSIVERSAAIIVRHELSLAALTTLHPESKGRSVIIPHYLPHLMGIAKEEISRKMSSSGQIRLAFVGHQAVRKGLRTVVKALALLPRNLRGRLKLTVISAFRDGPVSLPEDVEHIWSATHDEVAQVLRRSHMFVMPSHSDAFAKAFVESMAAGCAIICGNRQPQKFLFSRFGCAVDPNSPAELAEAIAELASNRDLTARFATASREAFSKSYDPELVGEAYFNTFLDVINGRALSQRPVADLAAARPS